MSALTGGWVNAHTHLYSGLVPFGLPAPRDEPTSFIEILERVWWRLDRALEPNTLRAAARYYIAEALCAGTTAIIDHHESPELIEGSLDILADACQELGMRAVLCYGATERNGGQEEATLGLKECRRFIERNKRPLVRGVIGVHASFTVSDDTLRAAGELARELGSVVHLHVAEDDVDVQDARARGHAGGVLERLLALDALPAGSILAHGVHLTEDDVRRAAELGLWLVQNPRSNRGNQVGYPASLRASKQVAIGTDGYPSDMLDEGEMLLLEAASHGDDLDLAGARLGAGAALLSQLFGGAAPQVETGLGQLVVDGRDVLSGGMLLTADIAAIRAEAREAASRLWSRMEPVA